MLNNFINPSWLSEVQKLQKQFESINYFEKQLSSISNVNKQMEILGHPKFLHDQSWLKTTKSLAEQSILQSLAQPEWIKSITRVEELSRQANQTFDKSSSYARLMESVEQLKHPFLDPKVLSIFEQSNQFLKIAEQNESFSKLISNLKEATKLYHLDAFESIANLHNSPLNRFSELANDSYLERLYSTSLKDLDEEIISEIGHSSDFEKLPSNVQSKIIQYVNFILLTIILNLLSNYIYDQRGIILQSLKDMTEPSQVKSFVRNGSSKYPREVLKGLRVVSGKNVNLRTEPSMKSEIILQLDTGTLIEVLDKSNRSWLLVEVSNSEEVIQGWIARRYTVHFK